MEPQLLQGGAGGEAPPLGTAAVCSWSCGGVVYATGGTAIWGPVTAETGGTAMGPATAGPGNDIDRPWVVTAMHPPAGTATVGTATAGKVTEGSPPGEGLETVIGAGGGAEGVLAPAAAGPGAKQADPRTGVGAETGGDTE